MTEEYKCPYCDKSFKMKHLLVNHVRQSSSGDHGKKYTLPNDFKEKIKIEQNKPQKQQLEQDLNQNDVPAESLQQEEKPKVEQNKPIQNITHVDPPEIPITKTLKCPDCGLDKSEWINVKEAYKYDLNLSKEEIAEYDYVCPNCYELIKVKS